MQPELTYAEAGFEVHRVVTGPLDNNVYFLRCTTTNKAVMIDAPGGDPELLVKLSKELEIETALITHGHHDHVGAIAHLRDNGIRVGIGAADAEMTSETDFTIADKDRLPIGDITLTAIATPGHTPGSTCFSVGGVVFSGDTLFPGGPGATRWPYSSFETIMESIAQRLFTLDQSTVVLPGHGDSTTIGSESPKLDNWLQRKW